MLSSSSSGSGSGGGSGGSGSRKIRSFFTEPLTKKAARKNSSRGLRAEIYQCKSSAQDDDGKIIKGAGPPTGKNIVSFLTGMTSDENAALAQKLSAAFPHGKTDTKDPFTIDSRFPGGLPLEKPSKVTKEFFSPAGLAAAIDTMKIETGQAIEVTYDKNSAEIGAPIVSVAQSGTTVSITGSIGWLDQPEAEYNWLSKLDSEGSFSVRDNAWIVGKDTERAAAEIVTDAKDLFEQLGYSCQWYSFCLNSAAAFAHCSQFVTRTTEQRTNELYTPHYRNRTTASAEGGRNMGGDARAAAQLRPETRDTYICTVARVGTFFLLQQLPYFICLP